MSPAAPEDDAATAAEHALGLLPEAEAAAFEARLAREPSLRTLFAEWEEDLARLADEVPPEAPPARVRRALMGRLFPGRRRRRWAWLGGLGAAAAIAVAAFVGLERLGAPSLVPLEIAAQDGTVVIAALVDPPTHTISFDSVEAEAPPGRVLQLWLVPAEAPPVPLAVLPEEGGLDVVLSDALAALATQGGAFAISEEPPGGSPTGQPTGAIVATGALPQG